MNRQEKQKQLKLKSSLFLTPGERAGWLKGKLGSNKMWKIHHLSLANNCPCSILYSIVNNLVFALKPVYRYKCRLEICLQMQPLADDTIVTSALLQS